MPTGAVLTGDIVNFTLLSLSEGKKMIARLSAMLDGYLFEFYRGDSFQIYIKNPDDALTVTFRLRAIAKHFHDSCDVRVSVGIGQVSPPVRTLRTTNSEAFVLSGRAFDELKKNQLISIKSNNSNANVAFDVIAYFADFILQNLTSKQAQVLVQLLDGQTQQQTAKKLKKAQATINQMAKAAGWPELQQLIDEYKRVISQFELV